jgi:hypothetical protein
MHDRIDRERHADLADIVDRIVDSGGGGSQAILVTTTTIDAYPAVPSAFYACAVTGLDGAEVEGGVASATVDTSQTLLAWNAGTQIPPVGTRLVAHGVGGRWAFRYDG